MNMKSLELNDAENTIIRQRETIELQNQSIQELNEKLRVAYNQISDQGHKSQLIDQQQAEIERLRAALVELQTNIPINPPPEECEWYLKKVIKVVDSALGQQQPEPPQESLEDLAECYVALVETHRGNGRPSRTFAEKLSVYEKDQKLTPYCDCHFIGIYDTEEEAEKVALNTVIMDENGWMQWKQL